MADTVGSGAWNSGGTWAGGVVPTTTGVIKSGHTVTVTENADVGAGAAASIAIQTEENSVLNVNPGAMLAAFGHVQVSGVLNLLPDPAGLIPCGSLDLPSVSETPPIGHNLTINPTGVVNANGTSRSLCQIMDRYGFGSRIDGAGALNATYTGFTKLNGFASYLPGSVFPEGAAVTRFVARAQWEYNMVVYGLINHNLRVAQGFAVDDFHISSIYYDAALCYYWNLAYTGDSATWLPCARLAADWQRMIYEATTPNGACLGYHVYTKGLAEDFFVDDDVESKAAALAVWINSAYAPDAADDGPLGGNTDKYWVNREAALALHSYLVAKDLGQAQPRPRYDDLVEFIYGHWEQIIAGDWIGSSHSIQHWYYIGLAFRSLWWDWTTSGDVRFVPKLIEQANYFWDEGFDASKGVLINDLNPEDTGSGAYPNPSPDTMLLTTPVFAFLWWQTGDTLWRDRYDVTFAASVRKGYMGGGSYEHGKHFNQMYLWSFQGEAWRAMTPIGGGGGGAGSVFAGAVIGR